MMSDQKSLFILAAGSSGLRRNLRKDVAEGSGRDFDADGGGKSRGDPVDGDVAAIGSGFESEAEEYQPPVCLIRLSENEVGRRSHDVMLS
jgi:hypothetical protein